MTAGASASAHGTFYRVAFADALTVELHLFNVWAMGQEHK